MEWLRWLQDTAFSTWIRESSWAIFTFLILHTLSMGFLVGTAGAINLRALGVARQIPLARLSGFLPIMAWAGGLAIVSGVLLVAGYPAKALTNVLFYVKLAVLVAATALTLYEANRLFLDPGLDRSPTGRMRALAAFTLLLWIAAVPAGKFLAYTHKMLLVY